MATTARTCRVLTESCWPHKIKAASHSWHCLWKYSKESTINQPISMLKDANEFASSMLMRRFYQHAQTGTQCANLDKFGQLYSHVVFIIKHSSGLLAISTEILPIESLKQHEKYACAHTQHPFITNTAMSTVLKEVARHTSTNLSHEQRFLLTRTHKAEPCRRHTKKRKHVMK